MVWIFDFATINEWFSDPLLEGDQARRCQDQSRLLSRNKSPLDAARRDLLASWEVRFRTYDAGKRTVVVGWFFAKKSVDTFLNLTSGNGACLLHQKWGLKQKNWIGSSLEFISPTSDFTNKSGSISSLRCVTWNHPSNLHWAGNSPCMAHLCTTHLQQACPFEAGCTNHHKPYGRKISFSTTGDCDGMEVRMGWS